MDWDYYRAIREMERNGVDEEYLQGWVCGYLGNPAREEQRVTERYEVGYADGQQGRTAAS